jgi:hypothetical protein
LSSSATIICGFISLTTSVMGCLTTTAIPPVHPIAPSDRGAATAPAPPARRCHFGLFSLHWRRLARPQRSNSGARGPDSPTDQRQPAAAIARGPAPPNVTETAPPRAEAPRSASANSQPDPRL